MKESIQLSELQNYLAYGLKLHQWGCGLNLITVMNANNIMNIIDHETNYKPLVRPLSELNQNANLFSYGILPSYLENIVDGKAEFDLQDCPFCIIRILLENHFDVFNFIGRGLALSLTDFEKEKAQ